MKKENLDELLGEALENARKDRSLTLDAFNDMKEALSLEGEEGLQKAMLVGEKPIKLLEQLTRSNEQIVRLAQIRERQESKKKEEKPKPISLEELNSYIDEEESEPTKSPKIRVKND